jgi:hypothetical protein
VLAQLIGKTDAMGQVWTTSPSPNVMFPEQLLSTTLLVVVIVAPLA